MRKAPCISTDQSEIQEATTNHKGPGEYSIAGSLPKIKEAFMEVKPNIQKLCDYINQQEDPERFMQVLFALVGPKKEAEKK